MNIKNLFKFIYFCIIQFYKKICSKNKTRIINDFLYSLRLYKNGV